VRAVLIFLIIPISMTVYFILATSFGMFQNHPLPHYLAMLIAVIWLVTIIREKASLLRWALLIVGVLMSAVFTWWVEVYSRYEPRTAPVEIGQNLQKTLTDATVTVGEEARSFRGILAGERGTLLVFYRGHW